MQCTLQSVQNISDHITASFKQAASKYKPGWQHGQAGRGKPTFAELPSPQKLLVSKVEAMPVSLSLGQSTQNPSSMPRLQKS